MLAHKTHLISKTHNIMVSTIITNEKTDLNGVFNILTVKDRKI